MEPTGLGVKGMISGILIILVFVFGFLLYKNGKPYNTLYFNLHKLAALGLVVMLAFMYAGMFNQSAKDALHWVFLLVFVLTVLALFASGGLLNLDKMHTSMLLVHRVGAAVFVLSLAGFLYAVIK